MTRLSAWLLVSLAAANAAVLKRDVRVNDLEQQIGRLPELDLTRSSTGELANHTSAVIELVLQNVHRLKNFEERARLERLVTRFKTLVDELQKPPRKGATQLADELTIDDDADENSRLAELPSGNLNPDIPQLQIAKLQNNQESKRNHDSALGLLSVSFLPTHQPPAKDNNKADSSISTGSTSTPLPIPSYSSSSPVPPVLRPTTTQNHHPVALPIEDEDTLDDDLDEDEDDDLGDDEDIDDDELVKELRHGSSRPSSDSALHLEFVPPGNVEAPRRNQNRNQRSESAIFPLKSDNPVSGNWQPFGEWPPLDPAIQDGIPPADITDSKVNPQENDDNEQVDNDVKLLNTVISNLRQVKEVLQRMRHNR